MTKRGRKPKAKVETVEATEAKVDPTDAMETFFVEKTEEEALPLVEENFDFEKADVFLVPFSKIKRHPGFPNSRHNPGENLKDLQDSLTEHGQLTPVELRRGEDGELYVMVGFRRLRAMENIRVEHPNAFDLVKAQMFRGSEEDAMIRNLIENIQREDLGALEIGEYLCTIMERTKCSQGELVSLVGKSPGWVSSAMNLHRGSDKMKLVPALSKLVKEKKLPFWTAVNASKKSPEYQLDLAKRLEAAYKESDDEGSKASKKAGKDVDPRPKRMRVVKELNEKYLEFADSDFSDQLECYELVQSWIADDDAESKATLTAAFELIHNYGIQKALLWCKNVNVDWGKMIPPFEKK